MLRSACFVAVVGISCFLLTVRAATIPPSISVRFNESTLSLKELTTSFFDFTEETTAEHEESHEDGHSSLALASWNYEYVAVPLDISLFILFAGLVKISKNIYIHHIDNRLCKASLKLFATHVQQ